MFVRDIMSSPAITVNPDTPINVVARVMRENQISGVPVVDGGGGLLGAVTELDLIIRHAPPKTPHYITILSGLIPVNIGEYRHYREQLRQILATTAGELMSEEVETVTPSTPLEEALELMTDPQITLLPVVEDGQVVGVITRTDVVELIKDLEMAPDDEPNES